MKSRSSLYGTVSAGLLLIGIGLIFLLKLEFFPAILAVVGLSSIGAGLAEAVDGTVCKVAYGWWGWLSSSISTYSGQAS